MFGTHAIRSIRSTTQRRTPMTPAFLKARVVNVYSEPGTAKTSRLEDLPQRGTSSFVVSRDVSDFRNAAGTDPRILDFITPVIDIHGAGERAEALVQHWRKEEERLKVLDVHEVDHFMLLPRLSDAKSCATFFGLLRSRLDPVYADQAGLTTLHMVIIGDALTWETASTEQERESNLGRAVGHNLWVMDQPEGMDDRIYWLTGGDRLLYQTLASHLDQDPRGTYSTHQLRRAAHLVAADLTSRESLEFLERRLRELRGFPASQPPLSADQARDTEADFGELLALLPGTHGNEDDDAIVDWMIRRRHARFDFFGQIHRRQRLLLLGGLFRADSNNANQWLRLRGPLLAYAVTRLGMLNGRWVPGSSRMARALAQPTKAYVYEDDPADALDLYLTEYMNKGEFGAEFDKEDDHWAVAQPQASLKKTPWSDSTDLDSLPLWWQRLGIS